MAQTANVLDTYLSRNQREQIYDKIYNVDREETPFLSAIRKIAGTAVTFEWQTDSLEAANAGNALEEARVFSATPTQATTRLSNHMQISGKSFSISNTQEKVNKAGMRSEVRTQFLKKLAELKRDVDAALLANQAKVVRNPSTNTVGRLAGIGSWITTNTSAGVGGVDPTGDGTDARTDGAIRPLTENLFNDVIQSMLSNSGKKPTVAYMGAKSIRVAGGFTGVSQHTVQTGRNEKVYAVSAVNIYITPIGAIRFEFEPNMRARDVLITNPDMWASVVLRRFEESTDDTAADAKIVSITHEHTLMCGNEKASGLVADVETT